jgi:hypothetical protein
MDGNYTQTTGSRLVVNPPMRDGSGRLKGRGSISAALSCLTSRKSTWRSTRTRAAMMRSVNYGASTLLSVQL